MYNGGSYFPPPLPSSPPPAQGYVPPPPQSRLPSLYYPSSSSGSSTFSSSPPHPSSPYLSGAPLPSYHSNHPIYDRHNPPPRLQLPPFHRQDAFLGTKPNKRVAATQKHVVTHECHAFPAQRSPPMGVSNENSGYGRQKQKHAQKRHKITVICDKLKDYTLHPEFESRYLLGDELGSGGFGFVMSATRYSDGQEVAVKFIYRKKIPRHSWVHDRVHGPVPTELYILLRITQSPHPNIIRLIEFFSDADFFLLVTELHGTPWSRNPKPQQNKREPLRALPISQVLNAGIRSGPHTSSDTDVDYSDGDASMEDDSTDYDEDSYNSADDPDYQPPTSDDMDKSDEQEQQIEIEEEIRHASKRESHDLFEMIETRRILTERQIRYIMRQLVDALWYLDSLNIYHRDIKDENILVDDTLTIKLIDFGSAIILPSSQPGTPTTPTTPRTQFNRFYGTLQYAPVEVLKSQPYDAEKCDVWALGILLFTCLTGQTPFRSAEDAMSKEWDLRRVVSDECREFLCKCLQKDPETRATIAQLAVERWWLVDLP
ncbi:kinase-like domain-containing protein [Lipomyces kononenkoae]|uniref:Kinase-like domain-containing protein n=1 Tax=Lipomyces kononenkoae TaxID=34357 RepID=A0ACC3TAE1_LIPKO